MRKKGKPRRGDGTAAYPLSFRHSFGVLMVRMLSCRGYAIAYPCLRSVAPLGLTITQPYPKLAYETIFCMTQQSGTRRDDAYHSLLFVWNGKMNASSRVVGCMLRLKRETYGEMKCEVAA